MDLYFQVAKGRVLDAQSLVTTTITTTGTLTVTGGATLLKTTTALTSSAGAATATLTNAPVAGNPTKWITIDDAGTMRRIPCW
jgi:hypothetical protein